MNKLKLSNIYIRIIWGRATLGEHVARFQSIRKLTIGRGILSTIRTSVWPLPDNLSLFEREGDRLFLNSEIPWQGLIVTGNESHALKIRDNSKRNLEIRKNSFATLRYEGITIAIRVGSVHPVERRHFINSVGFRGPAIGLIADTKYERIGLAAGLLAGLILTGAFALGLKTRPVWRPTKIEEIPISFRIPFISPTHLSTAPDVLQDKLDRFNFVESVANYYSEIAMLMTSPQRATGDGLVFKETENQYKEAYSSQQESLNQLDASSMRLATEIKERGGFVASVPVVRGESLDGSLQRILDKISLVSVNAKELAEVRSAAGDSFKGDPSYDYGKAGGTPGKDAFAEFTKRLGEGYRQVLPDEEQQRQEAKSLAVDASSSQIALFGRNYLKYDENSCCEPIVGLKAGITPVAYSAEFQNLDRSDENLASLKASIWGVKVDGNRLSGIIEPATGTIDSRAVESIITNARFQLQLCFELALRRNQLAKGNMEWKWKINSNGNITDLALMSSNLKDEELIQCVRKKIAGWSFPKPKGGSVEIQYPFEFLRDRG